MKTFLFSVTILSCLISHSSFAAGPVNPIPGAPMELEKKALELLTVLTQKEVAPYFADFSEAGNQVTGASVQFVSPTVTKYRITNRHCMVGGFAGGTCLGGSVLNIKVVTKPGNMPTTKYESNLVYLR